MKAVLVAMSLVAMLAAGMALWAAERAPADTVKQFYEAANQGKCKEAAALFTEESLVTINKALGSPDGFGQFCAGQAGKSPLVSVTVKKETKGTDRATVVTERSYKDGSLAITTDELVKQGAAWRMAVGENMVATPGKR